MSHVVREWGVGSVTEWKGMFGGIQYTPNKVMSFPVSQKLNSINNIQHNFPFEFLFSTVQTYWDASMWHWHSPHDPIH